MKKQNSHHKSLEELRKFVVQAVEDNKSLPPDITDPEALKLIHELEVHEIELEMQNEELRLTQASLEEMKYAAEKEG